MRDCLLALAMLLPHMPPGAHDAARQQQRHQHEQAAEQEQPVGRERAGRERGLAVVDDDRADHRADQRAAATDRDPDYDFNRIER